MKKLTGITGAVSKTDCEGEEMKLTVRIGVAMLCFLMGNAASSTAQRLTKDGPDNRPRYYRDVGVSLWPHEMAKVVRHGHGRVWIDVQPNGSGGGTPESIQQRLDVLLWSQQAMESVRIFDKTTGTLLLAKDGADILKCGELGGTSTTVFQRQYAICSVPLLPFTHTLRVEITDVNVNEFIYDRPLGNLAAEAKRQLEWLKNPK